MVGIVDTTVMEPLIQYEITAHQAVGPYKVSGNKNEFVPDLVSETVDT